MKRLQGKVAIVTGSGTGIGAATARRLVSEGAKVVLGDLALAAAETVAAKIRETGGEAIARHFDLMEEESIRALVEWTVQRYGALNILHNNAADTRGEQMSKDLAITDMEAATWDRAFTATTRGTMLMIKHAIPEMIKAGGGSIINTSSGAALRGDLFGPAYAASKAAINCLTLYVATQYGRQNIRCNVLSPGLVVTPTVQAVVPATNIDSVRHHSLMPYLGEPEDLAAV